MGTNTRTRIIIITFLAAVISLSAVEAIPVPARAAIPVPARAAMDHSDLGVPVGTDSINDISEQLTSEERDLVHWAKARFELANLDFPSVEFRFHPDTSQCQGHVGLYYAGTDILHVCALDKRTILHELAHAWAHESITEDQRNVFTRHRGLRAWNDHDLLWEYRATEHAAEIITWALMDRNILVPWVTEGSGGIRTTYRLLTIPDSGPDPLTTAYELLTGKIPVDRLNDDPRHQAAIEVTSPEARR